jgi:hypothetical protein
MKTFVKENWYKLMVGSSMLMVSFGFMMYAISPAYSNSNSEKTEIINTNAPLGSNGVIVNNDAYFVDGGYVYQCKNLVSSSIYWNKKWSDGSTQWEKFKLP